MARGRSLDIEHSCFVFPVQEMSTYRQESEWSGMRKTVPPFAESYRHAINALKNACKTASRLGALGREELKLQYVLLVATLMPLYKPGMGQLFSAITL